MRIIAVMNQKGGVGKTTTVTNIAHAIALRHHPVMVIDLDPQGQLTASLGINAPNICGVDALLLTQQSINELLIKVRPNLTLLPAGQRLGSVESHHKDVNIEGSFLRNALTQITENPAFVFIDCPPSSGFLTVSGLFAANEVLIPVPGDYLSLHGLSHLMGTLKKFEETLQHTPLHRVVMTRYHSRRRLARDVLERLEHYFPGMIYQTKIRETTALAECPSFGKTIFDYKKNSHGASDYSALADDILEERAA